MGHYLRAVQLDALNDNLISEAQQRMRNPFFKKMIWYIQMFLTIPYGKFSGIKKQGLTYYPEAPFNLSVAAAGPLASRNLAIFSLPLAVVLLSLGLILHSDAAIYAGRLCLGLGAVGLIDFLLADPGKYREYVSREKVAKIKSSSITKSQEKESWWDQVKVITEMMRRQRIHEITLPDGEQLKAPWQFRNCGMGGRHTEKEYPESNISCQELMFVPLCAKNYEEAQMITITLQNRFKEVLENEPGARVMGIGLEGGLAPYVTKDAGDKVPEERLWRLAKQTILDIGYEPGQEVAIAFDHAASELSNSFRKEFNQADSIGMYYFWRGEEKTEMSRDQLLELYLKSINAVPVVSFEDAYAEDDFEGWRMLLDKLGDRFFIIGDDLVTTRDSAIEDCADKKLMNTALIKANQIGTLAETMLAMLVALGKGLEIVVSHRSKSPNEDMEPQIALAANALGLKCGGGSNTERLLKYGAIIKIMKDMEQTILKEYKVPASPLTKDFLENLVITEVLAFEEPTNSGLPTVGVEICVGIQGNRQYRRLLRFAGATPLGTSAGAGEALHLVDSIIEESSLVKKYKDLFVERPDHTYLFKNEITREMIKSHNNKELSDLYYHAQRFDGRGCLNAVSNVMDIIAPHYINKKVTEIKSIIEVDRVMLKLEYELAAKLGKVGNSDPVELMQRKANLGMNAILSMSLALARLIAHFQGKELWQVLREEMKKVVVRLIDKYGDFNMIGQVVEKERFNMILAEKDKNKTLDKKMTYDELIAVLRLIEPLLKERKIKLYQALREQMTLYNII
ncbi:hypothetical protein A2Y85_05960 [candidate division WOR-3 bacterium RBG_13_43_14]|uniref:Enolase n=1 Tax=candidate division WOR-3 bacterium RBG_13_43_14 TaxID=1802590 RepID=A0A1F4U875_UNCW3|nr:MAG: hypothetical protein A2Y85_05960 [candidate division WOR-3 bacterium RBG_13_43_14]